MPYRFNPLSGTFDIVDTIPLSIASGGTNNTTAYTAGSVIFSNGTSLTQDNANFFWNDSTHVLDLSGGLQSNFITLAGSTSGTLELTVPATVTSYILSLPASQGAASSYLINDGSGNLTWTTGTPPAVSSNLDGGTSGTLYTSPQVVNGGTA